MPWLLPLLGFAGEAGGVGAGAAAAGEVGGGLAAAAEGAGVGGGIGGGTAGAAASGIGTGITAAAPTAVTAVAPTAATTGFSTALPGTLTNIASQVGQGALKVATSPLGKAAATGLASTALQAIFRPKPPEMPTVPQAPMLDQTAAVARAAVRARAAAAGGLNSTLLTAGGGRGVPGGPTGGAKTSLGA